MRSLCEGCGLVGETEEALPFPNARLKGLDEFVEDICHRWVCRRPKAPHLLQKRLHFASLVCGIRVVVAHAGEQWIARLLSRLKQTLVICVRQPYFGELPLGGFGIRGNM